MAQENGRAVAHEVAIKRAAVGGREVDEHEDVEHVGEVGVDVEAQHAWMWYLHEKVSWKPSLSINSFVGRALSATLWER